MKERPVDREGAVVAHDQALEVPQPRVGALDDAAPFVPLQRPAIPRCRPNAIFLVWADQFDPTLPQPLSEWIAVVRFVSDHPLRLLPWPAGVMTPPYPDHSERRFCEPDFRRRGRVKVVSRGEDRGLRPPPSTSSPCPAWFFRLRSPFFRGSKAPVQERFAPLQLLAFMQLAQKRAPDFQPNALLLSIPQKQPAGRRMRIFLRQVPPAGPAPHNPENPFQHTAVLDPQAAITAKLARFPEQERDFLPLRFGQQRTRSRQRPSLGAAESAYRSSEKTELPSFHGPVLAYATVSSVRSKTSIGR